MRTITIPATSANMGPGFDCMGIALDLHNTISFSFTQSGLSIDLPEKDRAHIPADARNLIYRVFCNTLHNHGVTPPGLRFSQRNDIPPVRGLGSSAACVVGGVVMADDYMGGKMTLEQKLELCAAEDGHPDNVLPALIGGITVGCMEGRRVYYEHIDAPPNLMCAVFIPPFPLPTRKARAALPSMIQHKDAVFNLSRAALLAASLSKGNISLLGAATKDRLHQPYREKFIPGYDDITGIALSCGALAACLSGAGPTILAFLDAGAEDKLGGFIEKSRNALLELNTGWEVKLLDVDRRGCYISD